jgi:Tol biopolymer transport system component
VHGYTEVRISPDGQRAALSILENSRDIWTYDFSRHTLTRVTFNDSNLSPVWTPDGKRLAFGSTKNGPPNLFWKLADGGGVEEEILKSGDAQYPQAWSPDGKALVLLEGDPSTGSDLWALRIEGERKPLPLLKTPSSESLARLSPDGRWMAYQSNESGRNEVYVQPFPGPGGKWQISTDGGDEPVWNPRGGELFFRSGDKMMAVEISTLGGFSAGTPRFLFEGLYKRNPTPTGADYDVALDGQHFLMIKSVEQATAATEINIVLNWFEELKRKVPTGK